MPKQKLNPRKIPRTQSDCDKAYKRGTMQKFNQKFNQTVSAILNGEVKYSEIVSALHDEYVLDIDFR